VTLLAVALESTAIVAGLPPEKSDDEWKVGTPRRLDIAAQLGVHRRLDDPPAFTADRRTQAGGGVDVRVFLSRRLALSLGWERLGLGHETTGITDVGQANLSRYADALWLGVRLDPLRLDWLSLYIAIGGGAAWQHVRADGLVWPPGQPGLAQAFTCSGTGSVGPGLRADLGLDALLGGGVRFFVTGGVDALRVGDGVVAECAGGAGSPRMISGRAGLSYSFDFAGDKPHAP
jgi:hypothetical protein